MLFWFDYTIISLLVIEFLSYGDYLNHGGPLNSLPLLISIAIISFWTITAIILEKRKIKIVKERSTVVLSYGIIMIILSLIATESAFLLMSVWLLLSFNSYMLKNEKEGKLPSSFQEN